MALLLAAGLGTRLRPITNDTPKCLVPIGGRPLLGYWIESMIKLGVSKIIINTHYQLQAVHEFIENNEHKNFIELIYEPELVGTGGTLRDASELISGEDIILAHADNFCLAPMHDFIHSFETRSPISEITMMTFRTDDPSSCGIVEIDDMGVVQEFHEKIANPPTNLASAAVFVLSNRTVKFVGQQKRGYLDFSRDVLPHFMGRINTWENRIYHRDIGTLDSYHQCLLDWEKMKNYV